MPAMDENVIKRIMPHSLEAEQSVIGSMFIDAEAIAAATEQISGEDFYNRQYGVVFDTIVELNNEGKPIDFVTLQDRLRSKEDVPQWTGFPDESDCSSTYFRQYQVLCWNRGGEGNTPASDPYQ